MSISRNERILALAAIALALAIGAVVWLRLSAPSTRSLLAHLPAHDAVTGQLDVAAVRAAGFASIGGNAILHEPEYEDFIKRSGFNWEKDLDRVSWSFTATAKYFLAEGRFDWAKLEAFVQSEGGECRDGFCTVRGSQPGREISFFPLHTNVLALAVSADRYAADRLREAVPPDQSHPLSAPPDAPLWVHFDKHSLENSDTDSPGLRGFLRILRNSEDVLLVLEPDPGGAFVLRLDAHCGDAQKARALADDLSKLTALLNRLLGMERAKPGEGDLASVLSQGRFEAENSTVHGSWPIGKPFLDAIMSAN